MIVLKLATRAQTVIQWLSSMVLKISTETFLSQTNVFITTKMVVGKQTKLVFFFLQDW